VWGSTDSLLQQALSTSAFGLTNATSVMDLVLPEVQRVSALRFLGALRRVDVVELLKNRQLERTALFPPVPTPSGQALDCAILLTGLLMQGDAFQPRVRREIEELAAAANRGYDSGPIEMVYLNITSLAKRMTWDQLVAFLRPLPSLAVMRNMARVVAVLPAELPVVFAAVTLAVPSAELVDRYLAQHPREGLRDLRLALGAGKGGLQLLLERQQPLHSSAVREGLAGWPGLGGVIELLAWVASRSLFLALLLKYLLWFDGAFCLARAAVWLAPAPAPLERPFYLKRASLLRQQTIGVLAVVLIFAFGEPSLARATPREEPLPVLRLNQTGAAVTPEAPQPVRTMSGNEMSWLALSLFFAVQLIVYVFCVIRLGEIKKQAASSDLKLKLLDNEENLFDSGLYVGLGGTVLQLVLVAFGIGTQNLMVAYASTLFGIAFVSVLKIFHVRRFRRLLLIEIASPQDAVRPYDASPYST
jgi:hypothetical protein